MAQVRKEKALRGVSVLLNQYEKQQNFRLFPGFPLEIQSPSFMPGLSGIGYFLLKFTNKGKDLPQALIFE